MNDHNHETTKAQFARVLDHWLEQAAHIEQEYSEEEVDRLTDEWGKTERELWAIPAPDIAAITAKFEIATNDGNEMLPPAAIAAITADLRRLAGLDASPIFQPKAWLTRWETKGGGWIVREGEVSLCSDPCSPSAKAHLRRLEQANGAEAVKAHILANQRGLEAAA